MEAPLCRGQPWQELCHCSEYGAWGSFSLGGLGRASASFSFGLIPPWGCRAFPALG